MISRKLIGGLVLAALLCFFFYLVVHSMVLAPQFREIKSLKGQLLSMESLPAVDAASVSFLRLAASFRSAAARLDQCLLEGDGLPVLTLSRLAGRSGVSLIAVEPAAGQAGTDSGLFNPVDFQVSFSGSYRATADYIHALEHDAIFFQVRQLAAGLSDTADQTEILLRCYTRREGAPGSAGGSGPAAVRKAGAPEKGL